MIKAIREKRCCKATVVFAKYSDYSELLKASSKERDKYGEEWILGSNVANGVSDIIEQADGRADIMRGVY